VALGFGAVAFAAGADGEPVPQSSLVEREQVRLVRLPIVVHEKKPGGCDDLRADSIEVVEDGLRLPATHLDPVRREALHAVLMDTSKSMLDHLQNTKRMVMAYVRSLPPDEPALLATFDDNLILRTPPSTRRERLAHDLEWTETGWGTSLWDSTRQLLRYLEPHLQRKIVILLTDGCDSDEHNDLSVEDISDQAARDETLLLFTVGIDLPPTCPDGESPVAPLKRLARATGGRFYMVKNADKLEGIFAEILARLDDEMYVSYMPPPFGEGARDAATEQDHRWRKLDVRLRDKLACEVSLAGSRVRFEGRSNAVADPAGFELSPDGALIQGTVQDLVKEAWPIPGAQGEKPQLRRRSVSVLVRPLEQVVADRAFPESGFLTALASISAYASEYDLLPTRAGAANWTEVPFVTHGRTLLDHRLELARALATRPDYMSWVRDRVRRDRLAALDLLSGGVADEARAEALEGVRQILRGTNWDPEPHELERYLGGWLGDIPSIRLHQAGELWMARRILAAAERGDTRAFELATREADRLSSEVAVWFPLPEDVRLLSLLVPAHDPHRDVIGFYRVVLPRPGSLLRTVHHSPEGPLGAKLLRWMLEQEGVAPLIRNRMDIVGVKYDREFREDLQPILRTALLGELADSSITQAGRRVSVALKPHDSEDDLLQVTAWFAWDNPIGETPLEDPVCLLLRESLVSTERGRRLAEALTTAKSASATPCVFKLGAPGD